jgi:hypothetical protein
MGIFVRSQTWRVVVLAWGVVWFGPAAPLTAGTMISPGAGDCEDYAIAKFVALRLAGVSPDDLRIVVMRDTVGGDDHAVAMARLDDRWLTLDNRRMAMVEDADLRNYRPLFVIDDHGVMRYDDLHLPASASRQDSAPIMAVNYAAPTGPILPSN